MRTALLRRVIVTITDCSFRNKHNDSTLLRANCCLLISANGHSMVQVNGEKATTHQYGFLDSVNI